MALKERVYVWDGPKSERLQIRLTPMERQEIDELCRIRGGISIGRYLLNLHHVSMGRLGASKGDAE